MKKIKETDIYPKFEFRLSQEDKDWLTNEIEELKIKFNEGDERDFPVITKNILTVAALKHGINYLKSQQKCSANKVDKSAK